MGHDQHDFSAADELNSPADWQGRARREATAILTECAVSYPVSYDDLVGLMAIAWMQGVNYGCHRTLAEAERAFASMQSEL